MTKDIEEDSSKKRRKIDTAETNGKQTDSVKNDVETDNKTYPLTIYHKVSAFEHNEALRRDSQKDLKIYRETCSEFALLITEIADLKFKKPDGWEDQVVKKKIDAALLTIILKKLNRIEKIRNKTSRNNVTKVRQQVDVLHLQLQNLSSEIQKLQQEVDKCLQFKSKPLGIDLVPIDEFYKNAPESISRKEITQTDEHQLQLARLEWELHQRKELSLLYNQLVERKTSISKLIERKINDLDSLSPHIKEVLNVTKPLQERLGVQTYRFSTTSDIASYLPHALYFLYVQVIAYSEACDKNIIVDIVGDKEKAKLMKTIDVNAEKDSSSEGSENGDVGKSQKREMKELKRKKLLAKHPLSVNLKMNLKDGTSLTLEFFYLMKLKIVTVLPNVVLHTKVKSSAASSLLQNNNILMNLFSGDVGIESPNVANHYQLREVGLDNFDQRKVGIPYLWAQKMGGLNFGTFGDSVGVEPVQKIAKFNLPVIMKEISRRIKSRVALVKQILDLENGTILGPTEMRSVKLSCTLKNWETCTWNDFKHHPATSHLNSSEHISQYDIFFKSVITREQAILTMFVSVKSNYPIAPPIFCFQLEWNDRVWNSSNNADLSNMEKEVNFYWRELLTETNWAQSLLMFQVHRAMVCLDITLECMYPDEFRSEKKTFFHPSRGRNRGRPYKYEAIGEGVFVQR